MPPEEILAPVSAPAPVETIAGLGFRTILGIVLAVVLALVVMITLLSLALLRNQVVSLLPPVLLTEIDSTFRLVLIEQAGLLLTFSVILLGGVYLTIVSLVAKPLRSLTEAMNAYVADGTKLPIPESEGMPREIRSLNSSFKSFIERVESGHQHDMEISRVKSDFISTAAHQFRTPLTGIRWALEALEKENLTADQHALVESAVGKSRDLVGIVGTLLDISSIESGKYHYKFAPNDMQAFVAHLTQDFSELAQKRKVSLFFVPSEAPLPKAKADEERIKWVLNNLIENAIRYTPENGTVRVSVEGAGNRIHVKVKDTGIGIAESDRANIFERFYRAGNAIAKENQGNGLGLYIARTIATDHGGDLNFLPNEDGPGTTFVLSLPLAR